MYTVAPLIQGSTLTTSPAVYYTSDTGINTRITQISLTNTDSVSRVVSIYNTPASGVPGTADTIIKNKTLQAGETWVPYQVNGLVIGPLGSLQAVCDANSVVVIKASGIKLTT